MMPSKTLVNFCAKNISRRYFNSSPVRCRQKENPLTRTWRILKDDLSSLKEPFKPKLPMDVFPTYTDIVIFGGGAMGTSIAYWLKEKTGLNGVNVVVIEKDQSYSKSSTMLSVGGLRQQFSLPENIQMSLFGAEFMRTAKKRFGEDADVFFTPNGYLMLASEDGASQLIDNSKLQRELGAINVVLGKESLRKRFPWLNVEDIEVGCLGLEKEGWFDPWSLLFMMKRNAIENNTRYITAEVKDFMFTDRTDIVIQGVEGTYEGINEVVVQMPDGEMKSINFAIGVIAGGAESGDIAKLAKIGTGAGMLSIPLPVERRKRYVYRFECDKDPPGINTPMTIDYTGCYFRRDGLGGSFIGGLSPLPEEEPPTDNLEVDYQYFDDKIWPVLAHKVPAFNCIKVKSAWSGFYDYNSFDENGIIGPHPYYHNLYIATGFSGHGIQQAPAVGRAIAELIIDGGYQTIDLTRLGFDRLLLQQPMYEINIV